MKTRLMVFYRRAGLGVLPFVAAVISALGLAHWSTAKATGVAPEVSGWWQQSGSNGVNYYICASDVCADNSMVSFKAQQARSTNVTLAEFETRHRQVAERNKNAPGIRDVRITEAKERTVSGVRVLQVSRQMDWADGSTMHMIEARLIGPERTYSMVCGSPNAGDVATNFESFLPRVAELTSVKAN